MFVNQSSRQSNPETRTVLISTSEFPWYEQANHKHNGCDSRKIWGDSCLTKCNEAPRMTIL